MGTVSRFGYSSRASFERRRLPGSLLLAEIGKPAILSQS